MKLETAALTVIRKKFSGYLARARARSALQSWGASGPYPKKCLNILCYRARVHFRVVCFGGVGPLERMFTDLPVLVERMFTDLPVLVLVTT